MLIGLVNIKKEQALERVCPWIKKIYVITLNVFFWGPVSSYRQERLCDKFPSTLFSRSNWPRQDLISIDVLITFSNKRLNFHRLCILCIAAGQDMDIYYTTLPLTLYVTHYLVPCGPAWSGPCILDVSFSDLFSAGQL